MKFVVVSCNKAITKRSYAVSADFLRAICAMQRSVNTLRRMVCGQSLSDAVYVSANYNQPFLYGPFGVLPSPFAFFFAPRVRTKKICNLNTVICRWRQEMNSGTRRIRIMQTYYHNV